jgi:hypothetical protein
MSGNELTLTFSGGGCNDVETVARVLEPIFGPADDLPKDEKATVHTVTFSSRLSEPVSVTLQGSPESVQRAFGALKQAFEVSDKGTAAGDQEQEHEVVLS